jgi:CHAT domain-containing protein/Tfp pilus assembly protein PilF
MKISFLLLVLLLAIQAPAQILKNIKNKVINDGKAKARTEVRSTLRDQVQNYRAQFDSTDFDYALLLSDNSGLFNVKKKGEFGNKFINLRNISKSIRDLDLSDEESARVNLEMGQAAFASEKFFFAEQKFNAARQYFEKAYLLSDFGYLKTIANQGLLYTTMGRFSLAEKYTAQALELRQEKLGETNMAVAASHNNYGVLHYNLGKYNEAEKDFEKALSVIRANKMEAAMPHSIVLNNQAMLYQSLGRYDQAEKVLVQSIQVATSMENKTSRNLLLFLSNLALLYQQTGKYAEAEKIYMGLESRFDKTKPEYANLLNNVATLCLLMKRPDKVEQLLKRSSDIFRATLTEESPAYAKVISDLGNFYRYEGRYAEAQPVLERALAIRHNTLNPDHPLYVQSQEDLAILHWKMKNHDLAYGLYHEVMEKSLDFINRYFPPMSEAEKAKYLDILAPRFERFYNFALEAAPSKKTIYGEMLEYRLATKGLLLNSVRKITESILTGGNEELVSAYRAWIDRKEELTRLYVYSKEELAEQSINVDSLESVVNTLEKDLSQRSTDFARLFFTSKTGIKELQSRLKADEAALEIVRIRRFGQVLNDESAYIALIVTKESPEPEAVVLENGRDLETLHYKAYRRSMVNKVNDENSYKHYWEAIERGLKGKKKLYVSLDGVYNQVSIYTLKKPGGEFLINQYDIVLLGNSRDLVLKNRSKSLPSAKRATLIGYPDYGSEQIPELPATKTEVDAINQLLRSSGYQVVEYTQQTATEKNLKAASKLSILHIATHGYFLMDVDKASWPIGVHADNARDNVLLRSGLMLTGASEAARHAVSLDSSSNGIITSYEAMNLDLQGTNLVVLSACETGLGEIRAGEGVYGLQRAFLVAGAEAIVMSLWKVNDASTQELMNLFYTNWIRSGDKQKAFKQAQVQLMAKYKQPYYWGAFVMMED